MNQRIKKLAEQANELDYETFDEFNHKTVKHYKFDKEKFAQLIVRECITQINEAIPDTDCSASGAYKTAKIAAIARVKDHFGVES
jgi:hypothetical protein